MSDDKRPPSLLIIGPPRGRGRPRVEEPRDSSLSVWLRPSEHDRLVRLAAKNDVSVSAVVRALLFKPR